MKQLITLAALALLILAPAQSGQSILHAFDPQASTGETEDLHVVLFENRQTQWAPSMHTVQLVVTGAPTGCAYSVEGSLTGAEDDWVVLATTADTDEGDCTDPSIVIFLPYRPIRYVRGNLTTLSGGTAPTVRMFYLGSDH